MFESFNIFGRGKELPRNKRLIASSLLEGTQGTIYAKPENTLTAPKPAPETQEEKQRRIDEAKKLLEKLMDPQALEAYVPTDEDGDVPSNQLAGYVPNEKDLYIPGNQNGVGDIANPRSIAEVKKDVLSEKRPKLLGLNKPADASAPAVDMKAYRDCVNQR